MPIGKVWIYCLLCSCVCVCVCTVTDFSAEDKASGGSSASKAGNFTLWGTLLPQKLEIGRLIDQRAH